MLVQEHRMSRAKACRIAGRSRAALYRKSTDRIEHDVPVVKALNETVERHGRWDFLEVLHVIDEGNREALRIECGR